MTSNIPTHLQHKHHYYIHHWYMTCHLNHMVYCLSLDAQYNRHLFVFRQQKDQRNQISHHVFYLLHICRNIECSCFQCFCLHIVLLTVIFKCIECHLLSVTLQTLPGQRSKHKLESIRKLEPLSCQN
jgi:hypothetical protein